MYILEIRLILNIVAYSNHVISFQIKNANMNGYKLFVYIFSLLPLF